MDSEVRSALLETGFPERSIPAALTLIDAIDKHNQQEDAALDVAPLLDDILLRPDYHFCEGGGDSDFALSEYRDLYGKLRTPIRALTEVLLECDLESEEEKKIRAALSDLIVRKSDTVLNSYWIAASVTEHAGTELAQDHCVLFKQEGFWTALFPLEGQLRSQFSGEFDVTLGFVRLVYDEYKRLGGKFEATCRKVKDEKRNRHIPVAVH